MLGLITFLALITVCKVGGQARDGRKLPQVVRQGVTDELISEIVTTRTRAYLSCESGEMVVKLNFSQPFRGVVYTDRASPCRLDGDGRRYYELRISLRGCGTRQSRPRVFVNNIVVRFHKSLELEEDEIKTVECRYPPPLAPPPNSVVTNLLETTPIGPVVIVPKLSEIEILLIICALLFVTLLLLGISIAYFCLKRRNIKVVKRKKVLSSGPGSEITKLSGSSLSMFDPIRIPRASAFSTAGSALLASGSSSQNETIPSDYPSESPSSVNSDFEVETDGRRSAALSEISRDNRHLKFEDEVHHRDFYNRYPLSMVGFEDRTRHLKTHFQETSPGRVSKDFPIYARVKKKRDGFDYQKSGHMLESIPDVESRSGSEHTLEDKPTTIVDRKQTSLVHFKQDYDFKHPKSEIKTITDFHKTSKIISEETQETTLVKKKFKKPKELRLTVKNIDDLYVTKTTEIEQNELTTREMKGSRDSSGQNNGYLEHGYENNGHHPQPFAKSGKWDVLFRVRPPRADFTEADKQKLRTLVNTDSVFRSLVEEAQTEEELVKISKNGRYSQIFDPKKWEVIIRILSPNPSVLPDTSRYVKNRGSSRRSSSQTERSVKDAEIRSLTEIDVDFTRSSRASVFSGRSSPEAANTRSSRASIFSGRSSPDTANTDYSGDLAQMELQPSRPALERSSTEIMIHSPIYKPYSSKNSK